MYLCSTGSSRSEVVKSEIFTFSSWFTKISVPLDCCVVLAVWAVVVVLRRRNLDEANWLLVFTERCTVPFWILSSWEPHSGSGCGNSKVFLVFPNSKKPGAYLSYTCISLSRAASCPTLLESSCNICIRKGLTCFLLVILARR